MNHSPAMRILFCLLSCMAASPLYTLHAPASQRKKCHSKSLLSFVTSLTITIGGILALTSCNTCARTLAPTKRRFIAGACLVGVGAVATVADVIYRHCCYTRQHSLSNITQETQTKSDESSL